MAESEDNFDIDDLLDLTEDDEKSTPAPVEEAPVLKKVRTTRAKAEPAPEPTVDPQPEPTPAPTPEPVQAPAVVESEAQRRIRELEAQLAAVEELTVAEGPSADDIRIQQLEDQLIAKKSAAIEKAETVYETAKPGADVISLHFLEDGLLVNGTMTYRGQEMDFEVGGTAYEQLKDRTGASILDILDDIDAQYDRWGRQYIARGPWRGRAWGDTSTMTDPELIAAAKAAAAAQARLGRAAPVITL